MLPAVASTRESTTLQSGDIREAAEHPERFRGPRNAALEGGAASGNRTPDPRITNTPDTGPPLLTQSTWALLHRHLGTPCTPSAPGACSSGHEPGHAGVGRRARTGRCGVLCCSRPRSKCGYAAATSSADRSSSRPSPTAMTLTARTGRAGRGWRGHKRSRESRLSRVLIDGPPGVRARRAGSGNRGRADGCA